VNFEFATAARIVFGPGTLRQIGPLAREFGRRALVVTGRTSSRAEPLLEQLAGAGVASASFTIPGEPTTEEVAQGIAQARASGCDSVIGFGGGSALDAAKAIAALLTNPGELLDYLEVVGRAQPLSCPGVPCIAIPTTAGTGSEVTRNAVLASPAHRVKVSLRSPHLLPRLALVDPELTYALPRDITAQTGLDALTQLIEPYVSARANPLTDALCVAGIRRAAGALRQAAENGRNASAREDMALASLLGGLALANAGLGAVHGFAGPIGGMFPAPHGAICACLLPHVMNANLRALRARAPAHPALARYEDIARLLTGKAHASADDGVHWVSELVRDLAIPSPTTFGLTPNDAAAIVAAAEKASSMKANPLPLTSAELHAILAAVL
jgi:alcohol dehydrogenase class IV